jgi:hypothetical protein
MSKWVNYYAPTDDPNFIVVGNEWSTKQEAEDEWERQRKFDALLKMFNITQVQRVALILKRETQND